MAYLTPKPRVNRCRDPASPSPPTNSTGPPAGPTSGCPTGPAGGKPSTSAPTIRPSRARSTSGYSLRSGSRPPPPPHRPPSKPHRSPRHFWLTSGTSKATTPSGRPRTTSTPSARSGLAFAPLPLREFSPEGVQGGPPGAHRPRPLPDHHQRPDAEGGAVREVVRGRGVGRRRRCSRRSPRSRVCGRAGARRRNCRRSGRRPTPTWSGCSGASARRWRRWSGCRRCAGPGPASWSGCGPRTSTGPGPVWKVGLGEHKGDVAGQGADALLRPAWPRKSSPRWSAKAAGGFLFAHRRGRAYTTPSYRQALQRGCRRAGVKEFGTHALAALRGHPHPRWRTSRRPGCCSATPTWG